MLEVSVPVDKPPSNVPTYLSTNLPVLKSGHSPSYIFNFLSFKS